MSYKENISEFKENLARANKECQGVEPTKKKKRKVLDQVKSLTENHIKQFSIFVCFHGCLVLNLFTSNPPAVKGLSSGQRCYGGLVQEGRQRKVKCSDDPRTRAKTD